MRYPSSCRECRVAKRKCTPDPAGKHVRCLVCTSRRIKCSNTALPPPAFPIHTPVTCPAPSTTCPEPSTIVSSEASLPTPEPSATPPSITTSPSPSPNELEFINLYFRYIHDRPHSLFHENSTWAALRNNTLPQHLWTAMCVMGCRFAPHQSQRDLAPVFAENSMSLLSQQLDQLSLEYTQTCVLLANWFSAIQDADLQVKYFGIANRTALALHLQHPNPTDAFIKQETKLRVWWSLVIADNWCPSSLGLPRTLRADPTTALPMDELTFQRLDPSSTPLDPVFPRTKGLWAYHATLAAIFALIQDINFIFVASPIPASMPDHVDMVAARLLEWYDSVPSSMHMTSENLARYAEHDYGAALIALHFGYHYYSIILYFQFLNPRHIDVEKAAIYAGRAKHHARSFSRLLHTARAQKCPVVYLVVAHLTVVSSSVLLHSLLFGDEAEVEEARELLTSNFEALGELEVYWPTVGVLKERLLVFQAECGKGEGDAWLLSRWTVRFLLEHALPFRGVFGDGDG